MTDTYDAVIHIQATADPESGRPMCLVTWGHLEVPLGIDAVRNTARELFAAAVAADADEAMVAELRETVNAPDQVVAAMLGAVRERRGGKTLEPGKIALQIETGVSATRWVGFVKVRRGSMAGQLDPDETRTMAQVWTEAAEAAERDAITRYALRETDKFSDDEIEALFGRIKALRLQQD